MGYVPAIRARSRIDRLTNETALRVDCPYCLVTATVKAPLLSPSSLSLTPSSNVPSAGILIGCALDPIGNAALLPTRAISPPTGIALTGYAALFSAPLPSGPAVCVAPCPNLICPDARNTTRSPALTLRPVLVHG